MRLALLVTIAICTCVHAELLKISGKWFQKSVVPNDNGTGTRTIYREVEHFDNKPNKPVEPVVKAQEQPKNTITTVARSKVSLADLKNNTSNKPASNVVQKTVTNLRRADEEVQPQNSIADNTELTVNTQVIEAPANQEISPYSIEPQKKVEQVVIEQPQPQPEPAVIATPAASAPSLPQSLPAQPEPSPAPAPMPFVPAPTAEPIRQPQPQPQPIRQPQPLRPPTYSQPSRLPTQSSAFLAPSRLIIDSDNNLSTHQSNQITGRSNLINGLFNDLMGNSNLINNGNFNQVRGSSNVIQQGSGNVVMGHGNFVSGTGNIIY